MSQSEKAELYAELKNAGVQFEKHYREYSTEQLQAAVDKLRAERPQPQAPSGEDLPLFDIPGEPDVKAPVQQQPIPQRPADPNEMAGQRQNTKAADEPIRVDENGLIWYQEEVRKPAFPKPRGRRVLQYQDTGVKTETVKAGEYTESFEVAGDRASMPAQIKITLPSYQVGIYKDPRFPFKIHVYNEARGFNLFEVQDYYGGSELVPPEVKKVYVENVLCYDIRSVVRAIQTEYRQQQLLAGRPQL